MTEKRFVETISTGIVTDTVTGKEYRCEMRIDEDLLELLNELHEENKRLKSDLTHTKVLLNSMQDKYSGLLKLVHGFNGDEE